MSDSIYCKNNPYGYIIDVNYPAVYPIYEQYKKKIGAVILSDNERKQFDKIILKRIEKIKNDKQSNTDGAARR